MELKIAGKEDIDDVVKLCRELHENVVYSRYIDFNEDDTRSMFLGTLDMPKDRFVTILLLNGIEAVGIIACAVSEQFFNKTDKIGLEVTFWITPEHDSLSAKKKLLSAYYYWARMVGCKIAMVGRIVDKNSAEKYTIKDLR